MAGPTTTAYRQYLAVIKHYVRCFRALVSKSGINLAGFLCSQIGLVYVGKSVAHFLGVNTKKGEPVELEVFLKLVASSLPLFFIFGLVMFMVILFHKTQRQEMLARSIFPVPRGCLALMKTLDVVFNYLILSALVAPAVVIAFANCRSMADVFLVMACVLLAAFAVMASCLVPAMLWALCGWLYTIIPRHKIRFTLFQLLFLSMGSWCLAALCYPMFSMQSMAFKSVGYAVEWHASTSGSLAPCVVLSIILLAAIIGLATVTLVVIARFYVDKIEVLDSVLTTESELRSSLLAKTRFGGSSMRPELAICLKDLTTFFRSSSEILMLLAACLLGGMGLMAEFLNPKLLEPFYDRTVADISAPVIASLFCSTAIFLWSFEATDGVSLAAYPVSIQRILKGKTLGLLVLQVPLIVGYLLFLCWGGLSMTEFWCWLFFCSWLLPGSLMGVLVGAYMNMPRGTQLDFGGILKMFMIALPVSGLSLGLYSVIAIMGIHLHWIVFPIACIIMVMLFFVLLDNVWLAIPWLRRWTIHRDEETRRSLFRRRVQEVFGWSVPMVLLFLFIGEGDLPFRLLPPAIKIAMGCAPIVMALVLFGNRLSRIWRYLIASASLVALTAGTMVRLHDGFGINALISHLDPILTRAIVSSKGLPALDAQVCGQLGIPENATPVTVVDLPPLAEDKLALFVKFCGTHAIEPQFYESPRVRQWLDYSLRTTSREFRVRLWNDMEQWPKVTPAFKHHYLISAFDRPADWTSEMLHTHLEHHLRQLTNMSPLVGGRRHLKRLSRDQVKQLEGCVAPLRDAELQWADAEAKELIYVLVSVTRLNTLVMLPYGGGYDFLQETLMDRRIESVQRHTGGLGMTETLSEPQEPPPKPWDRMPPKDELLQADQLPDAARMEDLRKNYPQYARFVLAKHPAYYDSPQRFARDMPKIKDLTTDIDSWTSLLGNHSDEHIRAYVAECGGIETIRTAVADQKEAEKKRAMEKAEDEKSAELFEPAYDPYDDFLNAVELVCLDETHDYDGKRLTRMSHLLRKRSLDTIRGFLDVVLAEGKVTETAWFPILSRLPEDEFIEANRMLTKLGVPVHWTFPSSAEGRTRRSRRYVKSFCRFFVSTDFDPGDLELLERDNVIAICGVLREDPALCSAYLTTFAPFLTGAEHVVRLMNGETAGVLAPYQYRDLTQGDPWSNVMFQEAYDRSLIREGEGATVRWRLYHGRSQGMHLLPQTFTDTRKGLPNLAVPFLLTALFCGIGCLLFCLPGFKPALSTAPVKQTDTSFPNFVQGLGMVVGYVLCQLVLFGFLLLSEKNGAALVPDNVLLPSIMAGFLTIFMSAHLLDRPTTYWLPLKKPGWKPAGLIAVSAVAIALVVGCSFLGLLQIAPPSWKLFAERLAKMMPISGGGELIILIVVAAPVIEEILFRGLMLPGFVRNYGESKALILSSLLFALAHGNPIQFASALPLGIILGYVRLRSGNLTLCILMHMAYNLAVITVLPNVITISVAGLGVTAAIAAVAAWICLQRFSTLAKKPAQTVTSRETRC